MHELEESTRNVYDREAAAYVATTGNLAYFPGLESELERFCQRIVRTSPILDLGSGVGRDTEYLLRRGCKVIAGDVSSEMLKILNHRCGSYRGLQAVNMSMLKIPIRDSSLGGAWVCASLLHLPRSLFPTALREIYRTLAPGSVTAISMKAGNGEGWHSGASLLSPRWFTLIEPSDLEKLLLDTGFENVASAASGRGSWFISEAIKL